MLGTSCGLLFGLIHRPDTGVRDVSWKSRQGFCIFVIISTVYASISPWVEIPYDTNLDIRYVTLVSLGVIAATLILCILKDHPESTYMHDAKWCILGFWISKLSYQLYFVSFHRAQRDSFLAAFSLALNCSMDSVVICWMFILTQSRLKAPKLSLLQNEIGFCWFCW